MARLGGEPAVGAKQPGPCAANAISGSDLFSLYIMLGIGVAIMLYVRFLGGSDYFKLPRETYEPPPNQPWPPLVTQRSPDLSRCSDAVERGWPSLAA